MYQADRYIDAQISTTFLLNAQLNMTTKIIAREYLSPQAQCPSTNSVEPFHARLVPSRFVQAFLREIYFTTTIGSKKKKKKSKSVQSQLLRVKHTSLSPSFRAYRNS